MAHFTFFTLAVETVTSVLVCIICSDVIVQSSACEEMTRCVVVLVAHSTLTVSDCEADDDEMTMMTMTMTVTMTMMMMMMMMMMK